MTTGARRILLSAAFLAGALAAQAGFAADWGLEQLMRDLGQVKSARAKFTERKHVAILNQPLDSSGTLIYTAPDRLEKHTLSPRRESMVLERDRLTLERTAERTAGQAGENKARTQRRTFALRDHPAIWALVESIRSTLAGDLATLKRFYDVALEGDERRWRLVMKPVEPVMQDMVGEIRIGGSRDRVETVEVVEANGDRSLMSITRDAP